MKPTREEISERTCRIVQQIVDDWGLEASPVNDTRLIADLGFTSMDIIDLLASIETQLGRKLPYERLIVIEGGGYRQELTVADLVAFIDENYDISRAAPGAA